jgi:hypothetical protein
VTARVAVEQASPFGWGHYVGLTGRVIGMSTFGASAPLKELQREFKFTAEAVADAAREQLARRASLSGLAAAILAVKCTAAAIMATRRNIGSNIEEHHMNPTQKLHDIGQSLWLDSISRSLLSSGTIGRYIKEFAVTGSPRTPRSSSWR